VIFLKFSDFNEAPTKKLRSKHVGVFISVLKLTFLSNTLLYWKCFSWCVTFNLCNVFFWHSYVNWMFAGKLLMLQ